jgi:hypothetical protein
VPAAESPSTVGGWHVGQVIMSQGSGRQHIVCAGDGQENDVTLG